MKNKISASIAIVTYNRPNDLRRCLVSLTNQTEFPNKILVIDNDPARSSMKVYQEFKKRLPLYYHQELKKGTANARNCALQLCSDPWLGFVDDDCVLDESWVHEMNLSITQHPDAAFIQGQSLLLNKDNIWAQSHYSNYKSWFNSYIDSNGHKIKNSELLDTKNVVINMHYIRKHQLTFDVRYYHPNTSGNEDIDLGRQLAAYKVESIYNPNMKVRHKDPDSLKKILVKAYGRGWLWYIYCHKWNQDSQWVTKTDFHFYRSPISLWYLAKKISWIVRTLINPKVIFERNPPISRKCFLLSQFNDFAYAQGFHDATHYFKKIHSLQSVHS